MCNCAYGLPIRIQESNHFDPSGMVYQLKFLGPHQPITRFK